MRVHIISDMEGVAGIVRAEQTSGGEPLYDEGRKLYTEEINAAVRGAKAAGAKEIVVMDHHGAGKGWSFNSLLPEALDPACEFVVQSSWTQYTEFLEEGCDACLLVGMHAMAGTPDGVLNHTVSGREWFNLRFNGVLVGETAINAALCGNWNCPVVLVTGDEAACREAKALLGDGLTTVSVKTGIGAGAARNLTPTVARELIEEGARDALKDLTAVEPYDPGRPAEIEVDFMHTGFVDSYRGRNGVEIIGPRSICARADDWWTAWRNLFLEPSLP
ncbi:MAG: M55 family metallopeptidase [Actinobacteria bacterium]|nr:M55 family metallopeptidase [Actinomycetota bacterium]